MQANAFETLIQPYSKLMRANMELFTKFSMSPEVMSQSWSSAQKLFEPGRDPAAALSPSNAYVDLVTGLFRNLIEFWTDLAQSGLSFLDQSQEALLRRAPVAASEAARAMSDMAQGKPPRSRTAA